jgi:hypothetical protein
MSHYILILIPIGVFLFAIMANNFKKSDPNKTIESNYYLWILLTGLTILIVYNYFSLPFYIFMCYLIFLFFA